MLVPQTEPLAFSPNDLPREQQQALSDVMYWKGHPEGELDAEYALQRDEAKKRVEARREELARQGVDLDELYESYVAWATEIERRGTLTEQKHDNRQIAIAGYLLPLEFDPNARPNSCSSPISAPASTSRRRRRTRSST